MSQAQHDSLRQTGRLLAKGSGRFGIEGTNSSASLIEVGPLFGGSAGVKILDAVGVIAVHDLQLRVQPKIPPDHFLEIAARSRRLPRIGPGQGLLRADVDFAVLLCQWFLIALERILSEGLSRDYRGIHGESATVRGRLDALATARLFYRRRLAVAVEFEEFDYDTPLNRVLLAAGRRVAAAAYLPNHLRRRAVRAVKQMDSVGRLRPMDLTAEVDRMTAHYSDSVLLAKEVIAATGRSLDQGEDKSWTFLFRSPIPVEEGLRSLLAESCKPTTVRKATIRLGGGTMTVNPDLVFGDFRALGDVKYKIGRRDWNRADLYEVVAFAAAARVTEAVLVDFREPGVAPLPPVAFDDITVSNVSWPADPTLSPAAAKDQFLARTSAWLESVPAESEWALLGSNQ